MYSKQSAIASLFWGTLTIVLMGCLFVLTGCKEEQKAAHAEPGLPSVSTMTVAPLKVALATELPGRTASFRLAEIRPQVNGLIQKRLFTEGADVKAGQILYQIDPAPFQASLDNARAALERAKAKLPSVQAKAERTVRLYKSSAISEQDKDDAVSAYEEVKADIQFYQASVEKARIDLGYTRVTSPISGRIGKSNVTEGAIVTAYQASPLASIQQFDPIYVDIPQSTSDLLRLRSTLATTNAAKNSSKLDEISLRLENGQEYPLKGTLEFRDVTVDQTTGSVTLRAVFPNPEGILLPGMFIVAVVPEGTNDHAILVPQQAVSRDAKGNPYALTVDAESKVVYRPLALDRAMGDQWLVAKGLVPGDTLIVEGLMKVRPGMKVQTVPFHGDDGNAAETPQKN